MKRILPLCVIGAIVAGVSVAQAAVTTNDVQTIAFANFVPCANGGAGEVISGSLQLHILTTVTVNGNKLSAKFHFQPQSSTLVGAITGDAYQATGVTQGSFNGTFRNGLYTETDVNNFRLIGSGLSVRRSADGLSRCSSIRLIIFSMPPGQPRRPLSIAVKAFTWRRSWSRRSFHCCARLQCSRRRYSSTSPISYLARTRRNHFRQLSA